MSASAQQLPKVYLRVPPRTRRLGPGRLAARALRGAISAPVYATLGHSLGVPGAHLRWRYFTLGLRELLRIGNRLPPQEIYKLIVYPMDSVRYFEFDFIWRAVADTPVERYLDVSSPRLLPLSLLRRWLDAHSVMLNPDASDLSMTVRFARAMGVWSRCSFREQIIGALDASEGPFDLITSISVLEHIPADREAIERMWSLLRPGGRLLITVPCAASASEEYMDTNKFGVLDPGQDGFVFWQRYYDLRLLRERIFSVTGAPSQSRIYGEKRAGSYARNVEHKLQARQLYPVWREPYLMARDYRFFESVDELPGMGVIAMQFEKPLRSS